MTLESIVEARDREARRRLCVYIFFLALLCAACIGCGGAWECRLALADGANGPTPAVVPALDPWALLLVLVLLGVVGAWRMR